ncbi:unnamed protein product [Microthlaspi erraticum]|uniref:F-box domain-containing protein n=1 Tax=Microthlaspi erraticum TaxID=1685480 RepID=A0A6D2HZ67_9BRAS|nr:unnamed protein product [Microthlaspi erraticum]
MEKLKQTQKDVPDPIPSDLLIDIFSRVPGKSVGRFHCLSKFWRSTLGLPYFTELFFSKSLASPRLLFSVRVDKKLFLFSSPQPHNPVNAKGTETISLGYDPINKQFKVFCTNRSRSGGRPYTHHWVLTLGTGKLIWRPTMECEPHHAGYGEICINGVLYYGAYFEGSYMMVCFDFTSEKFRFVKMHEETLSVSVNMIRTLINYKGNLGLLVIHGNEVVLWVLEEDAGNHKWSKSICAAGLTSFLSERIRNKFYVVGMNGAGEIVLSTYDQSNPLYIVYYNIEKNTFKEVQIMGFEEFQHGKNIVVSTFLDYVENIKLV